MTTADALALASRYRHVGVLLDANMLLVLLLGFIDPELIATCTRTKKDYDKQDFEMLVALLGEEPSIIITPHVATEASNLGGNALEKKRKGQFFGVLANLVRKSFESRHEAKSIVDVPEYARLGLTDAGLIKLGRPAPLVISADLPLCLALEERGRPVINYNHLYAEIRGGLARR